MDDQHRLSRLHGMGLTENQAKAYVALVDLGRASASALSKVSGVPRNKVYGVVEELNERGLVDVLLEDPIVFEPRPVAEFVSGLIDDLQARQGELEGERDRLAEVFRIKAPTDQATLNVGTLRMFRGRRAVVQQLMRMARLSKRRVRSLYTPYTAARVLASGALDAYGGPRPLDEFDIEVYTPLIEENADAVAQVAARLGRRLRISKDGHESLSIMLVDDAEVMFTHFVPDNESLSSGDDVGVWTDNPVFLALARGIFRQAATGSLSFESAHAMVANRVDPPRYELVQDAEKLRALVFQNLVSCVEADLLVPQADVDLAMRFLTDDEQARVQADKVHIRIISDCEPEVLRSYPWGPKTSVRHVPVLPARLARFDRLVLRAYDLDETGGALFGGAGTLAVSSDLPAAVTEVVDHFERLWREAEVVRSGPGIEAATKRASE